jgi:hypothetical protein
MGRIDERTLPIIPGSLFIKVRELLKGFSETGPSFQGSYIGAHGPVGKGVRLGS